MCSFIFTTKSIADLDRINKFNRTRGPDLTVRHKYKNYEYVHNLLSITGEYTQQPIIDSRFITLFNGEIYNFKDISKTAKSDAYCIPVGFEKLGINSFEKLDGEFSILLHDKIGEKVFICTDVFGTKPLYINADFKDKKQIMIATYSSVLRFEGHENIKRVPPNTILVICLNTFNLISQQELKKFDISNQYKDHFDDWCAAFSKSIEKRTQNTEQKIFLGLSSGYDSGAIDCELKMQNVAHKTYTIKATENIDIINKRIKNDDISHYLLNLSQHEYAYNKDIIKEYTEDFITSQKPDTEIYNIKEDQASVGLSAICNRAKLDGYKIYLSGQGADEILSDYGYNGTKIFNHSEFGGLFPSDLATIFPWRSFYGGTQYCYITKEEYIAGTHGIETRYPFLDYNLVQEFLWLKSELKNIYYKSPLHVYLKRHNYPFDENIKLGFSASRNLT